MKIGIVISTYRRDDGKTPEFLTRALTSVYEQSHNDYKVFLIGDRYEDDLEFKNIASSIIPTDKIYYENLPIAVERERYTDGGLNLWNCGGANAYNYGIGKAIEEGFSYICHLDHDDYWDKSHLYLINYAIDNLHPLAFIFTTSTYFHTTLPKQNSNIDVIYERYPEPGGLIHSSVCINHSLIPFLYRDTYKELGINNPSDADMWQRIKEYCILNNLKSVHIPVLTCFQPQESKPSC